MLDMKEFVDRKEELDFLEKKYSTDKFECVIIYGRRRVGKSELIKHFIHDKEHVYHLVTQEESTVQLRRLVNSIHTKYGEIEPKIDDWHDLFEYFSKVVKGKMILAIDEFPYLIEQDKSIPSMFQLFVDEYLSERNILLILCGSSISMMESLLTSDSPLYGRRTGQIDAAPFNFELSQHILQKKEIRESIEFYAVFGGTPFYLKMVDPDISLPENIIQKICIDKEILHEEPWMLLKQEFTKPHRYMSILESVAKGYNTPKQIADQISVAQQSIPKYLGELERIRLLKHSLPVTERNTRSRKGIYELSDNYFDFWFNFIAPNMADVKDDPEGFVKDKVMVELDRYVGRKFEDVCLEFVRKISKRDRSYPQMGRWWHRDVEIDILGLNERRVQILLGECKWSKRKVGFELLNSLKEKAEKVRWRKDDRTEDYRLFSKAGFTDDLKEHAEDSHNITLYTMDDIQEVMGFQNLLDPQR
ncbi:MAG: ATP-binding protein [Thermoplasmata archaeon]